MGVDGVDPVLWPRRLAPWDPQRQINRRSSVGVGIPAPVNSVRRRGAARLGRMTLRSVAALRWRE